jgi:PAS domain S-box-containing protein
MTRLESGLARYAVAVAATAVAVALRSAMTPLWGQTLPFIFFFPSIMLSAWFGGIGPGVLATLLSSGAAILLWIPPVSSHGLSNLAATTAVLAFAGIGILMSWLTGALQRARARLAEQLRALEADARVLSQADETRARLAAIVEFSDDAIVSKTLDGIITSWNAAATRMFGYAPDEVIGRSITIIIPKDRVNEETQVLSLIRRGEAIEHFRTIRVRKDQTPIPIELTVSPIKNAAGQIIGASKIARDISARVRVEQERAALHARERAARQEAEAANRAKDEFLAMLGHELRNPLAAISSAVQVLDRLGKPGDASAAPRGIIGRQTAHLARIMDDLLDIGRVMSGKVMLEQKPVDLCVVADSAVATLREAGKLERHAVTFEGEPVWIDADATRIEQIVSNLVTNSLKYTPPGASIRVRVTRKGSTAVLRVEDDGVGIAPDLLPRIFDLFVEGQPPLDRLQSGLGIGLALVKRLAELHGGTVEADSDGPGTGTAVTVTLPVIAPPGRLVEARHAAAGAARRVLIVEDNDDARDMLRTLLELQSHVVREAVDGPSGIETAQQFQPDVAIIDIGLPGLDGYEVAHLLRTTAGTKNMRLIALTGYGSPTDAQRARAAGFDVHLVKPVHPDRLLEILETE